MNSLCLSFDYWNEGWPVSTASQIVADKPAHLETGISGEDSALFYLRRQGYTVVARRWPAGHVPGDVDLIAREGPLLCFIEVKTRTWHDIAPAERALDRPQQFILRRLVRACGSYRWQNRLQSGLTW